MVARLPRSADVVVVGGGTAGATVAGLLAERRDRSVLLLEAGPDYGALDEGRWPADLLDSRRLATTHHDWGYRSSARFGLGELPLERARVIGGCSSHNGCAAVWGHRLDYDGWEAAGNPGWSAETLRPFFEKAGARLRIRTPERDELGPLHAAAVDAAPAAGLPILDELNNLDGGIGMAVSPVNVTGDQRGYPVRWNTAFAYLDPVRSRRRLRIVGDALVDRVVLSRGAVTGVEVLQDGSHSRISCPEVILSAGAYGSPAVLLRSGVGPPDQLRALDIGTAQALPGVGENLQDHPALALQYSGTPELVAALREFARGRPLREEGTIAKARSSYCRDAFDLHIYPWGGPGASGSRDENRWDFAIPVANMTPRSRGTVRLASPDPAASLLIDHAYLTDREDRDRAVLHDGVEIARQLADKSPLRELLGAQCQPRPEQMDQVHLRRYIRKFGTHYYHPVGTCKMGPASDRTAVVDSEGRVHGVNGLRIVDASIMPVIPRANTAVPTVVLAERIVAGMSVPSPSGGQG